MSAHQTAPRVLILGCGATGTVLKHRIEKNSRFPGWDAPATILATHRSDFDLNREQSWACLLNAPAADFSVWTFPAEPRSQVEAFFNACGSQLGKLVVIGSTGQLLPDSESRVTEASAIDLSSPRAQGEEFLRSKGAIVLRSAGIYGPGRNPLDWVKRGLVRDFERRINLVHVEDLALFVEMAWLHGSPGGHYIASDGTPRVWKNLLKECGVVPPATLPLEPGKKADKQVDNAKTRRELRVELQYPDAARGILALNAT